jgi:hypothetical protein
MIGAIGAAMASYEAAVRAQNYQQAHTNAQAQMFAAHANAYRDWSPRMGCNL